MESETLTVTERKCKDCGAALGAGREDRQYCDDSCRTNYNNRKRREKQEQLELDQMSNPEYITRIQEILLNNRAILEGLCSENKAGRIRMRDLIGKGFNTKFMTSVAEPTETGRVYNFCFEYGYHIVDNGYVLIVCRKPEVS